MDRSKHYSPRRVATVKLCALRVCGQAVSQFDNENSYLVAFALM